MTEKIDLHANSAARLFGVPLSEVTKEQRRVTKAWNYATTYSVGGIKEGLLVGQYPVILKCVK
jgi:DNA polymerase I-like protein with 3'-5' exonuclease and polymerase domains